MRPTPLALVAVLLSPLSAYADCQSGAAAAMRRAEALPPTAGRAALLEQIQRADVAHHEDDEGDCTDQLRAATDVLDQLDAARKRG